MSPLPSPNRKYATRKTTTATEPSTTETPAAEPLATSQANPESAAQVNWNAATEAFSAFRLSALPQKCAMEKTTTVMAPPTTAHPAAEGSLATQGAVAHVRSRHHAVPTSICSVLQQLRLSAATVALRPTASSRAQASSAADAAPNDAVAKVGGLCVSLADHLASLLRFATLVF